jgi:hypothetical protein
MIISGASLRNVGFVVDVQPIITTNLVANYDPATGISGSTFNDSSGNGYNATIYNSPTTTTVNGKKVLQLSSASSQYYVYPSGYTQMTGAVTFDVWFNTSSASTAQSLIAEFGQSSLSGGWNDEILGLNSTNTLGGVYCSGTGGQVPSISAYANNTWYNAILTYTPNTITLYINGVSQGSITATRTSTPTPLYYVIGGPDSSAGYYLSGVTGYFNGYLGAVKLYSTALTQQQVTQNFNALRSRYGV